MMTITGGDYMAAVVATLRLPLSADMRDTYHRQGRQLDFRFLFNYFDQIT